MMQLVDNPPLLDSSDERPLSSRQRWMWEISHRWAEATELNLHVPIEFFGTLDLGSLQNAIDALASRSEQMRTIFVQRGSDVRTRVLAWSQCKAMFPLIVANGSMALSKEWCHFPHLDDRVLFRAYLFSVDSRHHLLNLVFHRLLIDTWSIKPLIQNLADLYVSTLKERGIASSNIAPSEASNGLARTSHLSMQAMNFGNESCIKAAVGELRPSKQLSATTKAIGLRLNAYVHRELMKFAKDCEISIDLIVYAAIGITLFKNTYSQEAAFVIETPNSDGDSMARPLGTHGRLRVIRFAVGSSLTFRELVLSVKKIADRATLHDDLALGYQIDNPYMLSQQSFTSLLVVIRDDEWDHLDKRFLGGAFKIRSSSACPIPFDVCFDLTKTGKSTNLSKGIEGKVHYRIGGCSHSFIEKLISDTASAIRAGLAHPDIPFGRVEGSPVAASPALSKDIERARVNRFWPDVLSKANVLKRSAERTRYARPTNPTHFILIQMWREILNVDDVGIQDRFCDLGGTELHLKQLVERIRGELSEEFQATWLESITIAELTRSLVQISARSICRTVQPPRHNSPPPILLFHGDIDGGGYYARGLAQALGMDQPLYIFNPHGLDGGVIPSSIEEMASSYMKLVVDLLQSQPVHLLGYCNAGLVAFEIAKRLSGVKYNCGLVGLISTYGRKRMIDPLGSSGVPHEETASRRYFGAAGQYTPSGYRGNLDLYIPKRIALAKEEHALWVGAAQTLRIHSIEGDHTSCLTEFVGQLSEEITASLSDTRL